MNRKQFLALIPAGLAAGYTLPSLLVPRAAQAQAAGTFQMLDKPVPTNATGKQVEVVEFFWFGCPHCYALEPVLEQWKAKLPEDVIFSREHVLFQVRSHQQIYYTLDAMGKAADNAIIMGVFKAIHQQNKRMIDLKEITGVVEALGVDGKAFNDIWTSFGVRARMKRGESLSESYNVQSVPAIGVAGRFVTSPALAQGNEKVTAVIDQLVERVRKEQA